MHTEKHRFDASDLCSSVVPNAFIGISRRCSVSVLMRGSGFSRSANPVADNFSVGTHESRISHEEPAAHCPFLNRADHRCSENFNLDRLGFAFRYCFDKYKACPNYLELLVERRVKRATGAVLQDGDGKERYTEERLVQLTVRASHAHHAHGSPSVDFAQHGA